MSKYYIPEIKEFHPSFEYEFKSYGQGFVETEVSETGGFFQGEKRVKYLDREDIESLGFEQDDKVNKTAYSKGCYTVFLGDYHSGRLCAIYKSDKVRTIGRIMLFCGMIKNKSELKRIFKQIGIDDEK